MSSRRLHVPAVPGHRCSQETQFGDVFIFKDMLNLVGSFVWDSAEAKGTVPNPVMERLTAQKARTAQYSLIASLKYKQSSPARQASEGRGGCRTDVLLLMNNR